MSRIWFVVALFTVGCGSVDGGLGWTLEPWNGTEEPTQTETPPALQRNPCVDDVPTALEAVGEQREPLAVWSGPSSQLEGSPFEWPRYTGTAQNGFGLNNHIQSVHRLRAGAFVAVTGSNVQDDIAQLFIAELGSRPGTSAWGSNLTDGLPSSNDNVTARLDVDLDLWHAGGLSTLGSYLAVPIEGGTAGDTGPETSTIYFYDVSDPHNPVLLETTIEREKTAAAVALARTDDDRVVAVVRDGPLLDFYLSNTTQLKDGFDPTFMRWDNGQHGLAGIENLQNMQLLEQCGGGVYLVTANNTSVAAPVLPGNNDIYWFEVVDVATDPTLVEVGTRELQCDGYCNFDAGTGAFVTDDGELLLYGVNHFRTVEGSDTVLRIAEFR